MKKDLVNSLQQWGYTIDKARFYTSQIDGFFIYCCRQQSKIDWDMIAAWKEDMKYFIDGLFTDKIITPNLKSPQHLESLANTLVKNIM